MLNSNFFANFKPYLWPWQHADLIQQMAARDINARFRQSWLGLAWLVLTPLLMLGVYTLVFREVFQARWGAPDEGVLAYALRCMRAWLFLIFLRSMSAVHLHLWWSNLIWSRRWCFL